jgi:hypothetical protein
MCACPDATRWATRCGKQVFVEFRSRGSHARCRGPLAVRSKFRLASKSAPRPPPDHASDAIQQQRSPGIQRATGMKTSQRSCPTIQMVVHEFVEHTTLGAVELDRVPMIRLGALAIPAGVLHIEWPRLLSVMSLQSRTNQHPRQRGTPVAKRELRQTSYPDVFDQWPMGRGRTNVSTLELPVNGLDRLELVRIVVPELSESPQR